VKALSELVKNEGHELVHLRDRFRPDTRDDQWIPRIAREGGWVIVTHDINIVRSRYESQVWRKAGLPTFFFAKGLANQRPIKQMEALARHWDEIVEIATKMRAGAIYVINVRGKPRPRVRRK
jgi:hypothetical protein